MPLDEHRQNNPEKKNDHPDLPEYVYCILPCLVKTAEHIPQVSVGKQKTLTQTGRTTLRYAKQLGMKSFLATDANMCCNTSGLFPLGNFFIRWLNMNSSAFMCVMVVSCRNCKKMNSQRMAQPDRNQLLQRGSFGVLSRAPAVMALYQL